MTPSEAETIDALGLRCPEPVMMLHAAMRKLQAGQRVRLLATDPSTQRDVDSFCRFLGHELISTNHTEEQFVYVIQKAS